MARAHVIALIFRTGNLLLADCLEVRRRMSSNARDGRTHATWATGILPGLRRLGMQSVAGSLTRIWQQLARVFFIPSVCRIRCSINLGAVDISCERQR